MISSKLVNKDNNYFLVTNNMPIKIVIHLTNNTNNLLI